MGPATCRSRRVGNYLSQTTVLYYNYRSCSFFFTVKTKNGESLSTFIYADLNKNGRMGIKASALPMMFRTVIKINFKNILYTSIYSIKQVPVGRKALRIKFKVSILP